MAEWEGDGDKINCGDCQRVFKKKKKPPPCDSCHKPKLDPSNFELYLLSKRSLPGAFDGFGGLRYDAVALMLEASGIHKKDSRFGRYFRHIIYFLLAFRAAKDGDRISKSKDVDKGKAIRKGRKK